MTPQVTDDTVQWPVPAVDEGEPETTGSCFPAGSSLRSGPRAAAVLTPSLDEQAGRLVFTDPTKVVRLDGEVRSERPPLRVPVKRTDIVAVKVSSRAVSPGSSGPGRCPGHRGCLSHALRCRSVQLHL